MQEPVAALFFVEKRDISMISVKPETNRNPTITVFL
jgi:hypothetical protein